MIERNDYASGTYNTISQIKFKTLMLKSSLCDYSDVYIPAKGTILIAAQAGDNPNNENKEIVFKNCAPSTDCISETKDFDDANKDHAKKIDAIPMCNFIKDSDNYSKRLGTLWQYYRDKPFLGADGAIADFLADNNNRASFKFKPKTTGKTAAANGRKDVEIMVPLKYFSNFWRTLEMPLIKCEINLILTWSDKCMLSNDTKAITFAITGTKLYVPVTTLSFQDYNNSWNQALKEEITGTNINQK